MLYKSRGDYKVNESKMRDEREPLKKKVDKYIECRFDYLINLAVEICKIPSMTGNEQEKARFILGDLESGGAI